MKKFLFCFLLTAFIFTPGLPAFAQSSSEARQAWLFAKQERISLEAAYRQAKLDAVSLDGESAVRKEVDAAKAVLEAALDEAEAWLIWKKIEAESNTEIPADLRNSITSDVAVNLAKIETLRADVAAIATRPDVARVFVKMIGSYTELLTDVARNTGSVWVFIGNKYVDTTETIEAKLRDAAGKLDDNEDIIAKLDIVKAEIVTAKSKIDTAEAAYSRVVLPGAPLMNFSEGNRYLRQAKTDLQNAYIQLEHAYRLIISRGI